MTTTTSRSTYPDAGDVVHALAVVGQRLDSDSDFADLLVVRPLHDDHLKEPAGVEVSVETRLPVRLQ